MNNEIWKIFNDDTIMANRTYRDLIYVAKEYQKLISENCLYSRKRIKLPAPKFVVFYNGGEEQTEKQVLRLSDLYEPKVEDPELELKVTVYNINYGYNHELMERCPTLKEYAQFVACVRRHAKYKPLDMAIDEAVNECIHNNILKSFLAGQRAEVKDMWLFDYNEKEVMEMLREEAIEDGRAAGESIKSIRLIVRKVQKNKTLSEIAEALEEEEYDIEPMYNLVLANAPVYDVEKIYKQYKESMGA